MSWFRRGPEEPTIVETRVRIDAASFVDAYEAEKIDPINGYPYRVTQYYATCELAFADGGYEVKRAQVIRVGDDYYAVPENFFLHPVKLHRRAKGKRG